MLSQLTVTGLHTHRYEYNGFDRPFNDFSSCSFSRVERLYSFFFCLHNCDKLVMQISYVISNMYIQLFSLLLSCAESKVFHCRGTSRQRPVNFFLVTININHACRPCSFVSGEAHPQFPGLLFPLRLSLREKKLDRILLRFDLCYSYSLLAQNSS